ncbi:CHAT domain-containing protein [Actinomadura fibrosa]|uniref:CHAT domain-containing protein n=1 Tax=Actinomadura fibrosa TaxID=111802 RepID=A0ABW2XDZ7_9ACTN|nr:CHAT domain-containing protein [Actinomadura fibrosa]
MQACAHALPPGTDIAIGPSPDTEAPDGADDETTVAGRVLAKTAHMVDEDDGDRVALGRGQFLYGTVLALRATGDGALDDIDCAIDALSRAVENIPPKDPLALPAVRALGAVLGDRYMLDGEMPDADSLRLFFENAERPVADAEGEGDPVLDGVTALVRAVVAWPARDLEALAAAAETLHAAYERHSGSCPWRRRLLAGLGFAYLGRGLLERRPVAFSLGLGHCILAADEGSGGGAVGAVIRARGAIAWAVEGLAEHDERRLEQGIVRLEQALEEPLLPRRQRAWTTMALGQARLAHLERHGGSTGDQSKGIACLDRGHALLREEHLASHTDVLDRLAASQRIAGDTARAVATAAEALNAHVEEVLLRAGGPLGLTAAERAAESAWRLARWCLAEARVDEAVRTLETGRGLRPYAAAAASDLADLPDRLAAVGEPDLARAWRNAAAPVAQPPTWSTVTGTAARPRDELPLLQALVGVEVPGRMREESLAALAGHAVEGSPLQAFRVPELQAGLRRSDQDALVYLVPGAADEPGWAVIVPAEAEPRSIALPALRASGFGPLSAYVAAASGSSGAGRPGRDAVWRAALERWCDWAGPAIVTPVLDGLADLGGPGDPGGRDGDRALRVVLVPCGDLDVLPWQAARLGAGTRQRVVHRVALTTVATGRPLEPVVSAAVAASEDASHAVGSRWPVADGTRSLLAFMFRRHLADGGGPAEALRRTQLWMLDPKRAVPETMPGPLAAEVDRADDPPLADLAVWGAFTRQISKPSYDASAGS